jgi:16S rRNA (adenine1518-N6/adenine1519-N6)-dimethyltransferase
VVAGDHYVLQSADMLSRTDVRRLMAEHGLKPSRALGQNFVADPNTVRRIARLAGVGPGDRVVEIGAGLGSLTLALAETGASVTAVEVDRYLVPVLRSVVGSEVAVVEADAMSLDWPSVLREPPYVLVANLPYNVATPLVLDLLDGVPAIDHMLVMVQREVGERLAAGPGEPQYGLPSVKVAWWADARVVGRVPPSVFVPQPRVESALVSIVRRPGVGPMPAGMWELARAGFGQRRKMLRSALGLSEEVFDCAGVRPQARAEELSVDDWARMAACLPS